MFQVSSYHLSKRLTCVFANDKCTYYVTENVNIWWGIEMLHLKKKMHKNTIIKWRLQGAYDLNFDLDELYNVLKTTLITIKLLIDYIR